MTQLLRRTGVAVVALGLLVGTARPTQAALILTMEEVGADVVVFGSGTANLAALSLSLESDARAAIVPNLAVAVLGADPSQFVPFDAYGVLSGPTNFGPGLVVQATSGGGDRFGIANGNLLVVPNGYVSDTPLNATSVYASATFASLGVTPGTYVWTWGIGPTADTLTLQIVPEAVSLSLLAVGVAGLAVRRWRQRAV
jgi:hypothetical protein